MTSLKDRVKAATDKPSGRGPALDDVQHDRAADDGAEQGRGHKPDEGTMEFLRRYEQHFAEALPSNVDTTAFFAAVRSVLPTLTRCTPASQLQALLTCARIGLVPDGKQAVITASGNVATFIPTYRGFIELMYRSGRVDSVHVGMVHENDEWAFEPTAPAPLDFTHRPRPDLPKAARGPAILAYAFCWLKGGARSQVVVLSREDAEEIRDQYSDAYRRAQETGKLDSFWHTHFLDMWMKSAIRRLEKYVPTSAELRALGAIDDAGEAGQSQILLAPDPEVGLLVADAERAHRSAESSQDTAPRMLLVKGTRRGRSKPKKNRGGRRRAA
ncbi:recombinase RecT [Streptomyces brevispora]|uniref:recombinase RecT n=1 Tax=Streptomyces brevispora TaxID=887462 RepID=UPI0037104BED